MMAIADEKPVEITGWGAATRVSQIAETLQWLLIALILALFFRAFIMEAYRIPTGSMATNLKGAHFRFCCPQCGYRFDCGFDSGDYRLPVDALPESGKEIPHGCRCPNCSNILKFDEPVWIAGGDRILVLKCKYQFVEPDRWDVVVFKDPLNPRSNMIKRLVAGPGETVRIIDGDIYIEGKIGAKPRKLQDKLWISVYDGDYQPVRPHEESFRGRAWRAPWRGIGQKTWHIDPNNAVGFELDSDGDKLCEIVYDSSAGNSLRAEYAYNGRSFDDPMPYCSDLKVRFFAKAQGSLCAGAQLSKYGKIYRGWIADGRMFIGRVVQDGIELLVERPIKGKPPIDALITFANVDHVLSFSCNKDTVTYNLGPGPDDAGERLTEIEPTVGILAAGKVRVSHLAIFRDIHYTGRHFYGGEPARAAEDNGFTLGAGEYFVLGDNSPNSHDGRWWDAPGIGNNTITYRAGIVPRDYLVGKAVYVYWPSGFRPFENFRTALIPNFGQMRFIYGGSRSQSRLSRDRLTSD